MGEIQMKKILLLGGSAQQVIAIETAKKLGYYTVLCDYLSDNPGQYAANKFYLISTTDKEAVLRIAEKEKVNGVLAYASDPAAPTAAYVAEKLGLPSNSYESVETLCNKDRFRLFLNKNGFNAPIAHGYQTADEALLDIKKFTLPVIVKPVDSSGSKGVTIIHSLNNLPEALAYAFSFSHIHRIIIEEYIEKKHKYLIGGDIVVSDGKVILWGLMNCHRDNCVNPLVPVGKSFPLELSDNDIMKVKETLQLIVDGLHIQFGAMNVELLIDKNDRVWPIDVGPRNGGNMIPDLLGLIFGIDVVEMSVKMAMGEKVEVEIGNGIPYYATHNLHSAMNGIYRDIFFAPEIEPYIVRKCIYKKKGDAVEYFDNAAKALGIIFMKFENHKEMSLILNNIEQKIEIVLDKGTK